MSFDVGLFIRKNPDGTILTGEINLSSGYEYEVRTVANAEAALVDVEERKSGHQEAPYENLLISGFAPRRPSFADRLALALELIRNGDDST